VGGVNEGKACKITPDKGSESLGGGEEQEGGGEGGGGRGGGGGGGDIGCCGLKEAFWQGKREMR